MDQDSLFGGGSGAGELGSYGDPGQGPVGASAHDVFATHPGSPLAARMRPRSLEEMVGQEQLLAPGKPLRRLIEGSGEASVILYGPPGLSLIHI